MAVISDIHANLEALTIVLQAIEAMRVREVICLGDIVGYGADPNPCTELIRARGIPCIVGNHDRVAAGLKQPTDFSEVGARAIRWTAKRLRPEFKRFLGELPLLRQIDADAIAVHGALHPQPNEDRRIRNQIDAAQSFQRMLQDYPHVRICFFGHTHRAEVWEHRDGLPRRLEGDTHALQPDTRYLINPGSVGQSRDGDVRASFLLYDPLKRIVRFYRIPYDIDAHRRKLIRSRLIRRRGRLRKLAAWVRNRLTTIYQRDSLRAESTDGTVTH